MIPQIVGIVGFIIAILIYYYRLYRPQERIKQRQELEHFDKLQFIKDMKVASFEPYKEKFTQLTGIGLVPAVVSIIAFRFLFAYPINIFMTVIGCFFSLFIVAMVYMRQNDLELAAASNKPFGSALVYYPGIGLVPQLFRRMKKRGSIKIDKTQRKDLTAQIIASIKEMPEYEHVKKEVSIKKLEKEIGETIEKINPIRYEVDEKYWILLITTEDTSKLKTNETVKLIDRTREVDVNLIPSWMIFCDDTRHLFTSKDDKGRTIYTSRRMGIFMDIYNLVRFDADIRGGNFSVPDKMTALLGQFIHMYDRHNFSASEMTKTVRRMEKAKEETEADEFKNEAEVMKHFNSGSRVTEMLHNMLIPHTKTKTDYGFVMMLLILVFVLSFIAGRNWGG